MRSKDRESEIQKCKSVSAAAGSLGECFKTMARSADDSEKPVYMKAAAACDAMAKAHDDAGAYHEACLPATKAEENEFGKRLVPDRYTSVIPSDAPVFGVRAVTRPGQPPLEKAALENVHPKFRHLLEIGEA